jgi:hypothetical protein
MTSLQPYLERYQLPNGGNAIRDAILMFIEQQFQPPPLNPKPEDVKTSNAWDVFFQPSVATTVAPPAYPPPTTKNKPPSVLVHTAFAAGLRHPASLPNTFGRPGEEARIYTINAAGRLALLQAEGFVASESLTAIMFETEVRLLQRLGWLTMSRADITATAATAGVCIDDQTVLWGVFV